MASLKFLVSQMDIDMDKQYRHQQHDRDGKLLGTAEISTSTRKQYKHHAIEYAMWCRERFGAKTPEDCASHLQQYADFLAAQGLSACSIHTYLTGPCRYWSVPMDTIYKPQRVAAQHTRSRGTKASDTRADRQRDISPRMFDFAERVGCRRAEYLRLRGDDLVRDESGGLCVRIRRGKGGKEQLQRILPEDESFVASFFDGSENYVFSKREMRNKLDLHALRSSQARRAYQYYAKMAEDAEGREKLIEQISARFEAKNNKKRFNRSMVAGKYHLRGNNRTLALENGLPTTYERLAVLAVSVFHLSHWRLNVAISNYLLAF